MKWIEKYKPFVWPIQSISAKKPLLLAIHLQYIFATNFSWSADNVNVYQYQSCYGNEDKIRLQIHFDQPASQQIKTLYNLLTRLPRV